MKSLVCKLIFSIILLFTGHPDAFTKNSVLPLPIGEECELAEMQLTKSDCNAEKQFYVTINFHHKNTSDCFTVKGNGVTYGTFKYSDLPVTIGPLKGDCTTSYGFVVRDCEKETCDLEKALGKVCCESPNDCKLSELQLTKSDCNVEKKFYVTINFLYKNTSDCFTVKGNGVTYGTFKYKDLPIKIGPLKGDCTTSYEFVIRDCHNEKCALEKVLGKVCCETQSDCKLSELQLTKSDCNAEKKFFVTVNFLHKNTSDCFTIKGNGVTYGTFKYTDLPVKIGPLKGDCTTSYEFVVRDCHNEKCALEKELGKVCCETQGDCQLSELKLEKSDCNAEKQFFVTLKFNHKNTSECFTVRGNGVSYGTFKYADLPVKIGPLKGDCTTEYEFVVRDCHNEKCALEKGLGKVCCESQGDCQLSELKLEKSDCNAEKQFFVTVNFLHKNTSDCFTIKGNGVSYGTFKYADLPVKIGPLKGDCITEYEFVVRDCHNERCAVDKVLGKVCCESQGDCQLSELQLEKSDCNAEKQFFVTLKFNRKNTSECFTVKGNGVSYGTFKYADLPIKIGPLKGNCTTEYEFVVRDCHNEKCFVFKDLGKVCCEKEELCQIYELEAAPVECKGKGKYSLKVNFQHKGTSNTFDLYDRNGIIGNFPYSALPLTLPEFTKSGLNHDLIKVCDHESAGCCKVIEFKGLECFSKGNGSFNLTEIRIIPNQRGSFRLQSQYAFPEAFEWELLDLSGRKIPVSVTEAGSHEIAFDIKGSLPGIYLVRVYWEDEVRYIRFTSF